MQEAQNVSKLFIIFIITFYTSFGYSQKKIVGKYYVVGKFSLFLGTSFEFHKNKTFRKESFGDLGITDYGKGHFFIKKDSLILNYDLTKLTEESYHRYKEYRSSADSVKIKVKVYDLLSKKPLAGAFVSDVYGDIVEGTTKKEGVVLLKYKNQRFKVEIGVIKEGYIGLEYYFTIYTDLNYEISVYLKKLPSNTMNNPTAIRGSIDKYKILEQGRDYIKLKAKDGRIITWEKEKIEKKP